MNPLTKLFAALRSAARTVESRWFDWSRDVRTCGETTLQQAGIATDRDGDAYRYVPARVGNIREALRSVPVADLSRYTFIDLGCGKGRAILVAAAFPFRRIVGVELSTWLHRIAHRNATIFSRRNNEDRIETLAQNAQSFVFPDGPLIIYMYNPFGATTMQIVLDNLEQSLCTAPRHVVVIMLIPVLGHLVERLDSMRLIRSNRRHAMYEAHPRVASIIGA